VYDIDFIFIIIAKDLNMPSSDLNGILNIDFNLDKYNINAFDTLYGCPSFLYYFLLIDHHNCL